LSSKNILRGQNAVEIFTVRKTKRKEFLRMERIYITYWKHIRITPSIIENFSQKMVGIGLAL